MKATRFVLVTAMLFGLVSGRVVAQSTHNPGIVPINAHAHGKTYGQLAAEWWKWVLENPATGSAILDPTGADCGAHQSDHVWFLAGSLSGGNIERTCTVPKGTFLFFPIVNALYGAFLTDPDDTRTEAFVRAQVQCVVGADVHAEIDGVPVNAPQQYLEQSSLFITHFPADNVFGVTPDIVPGMTLDPTVDSGYYLYLNPLTPGTHTIHFSSGLGTSTCALGQDVTYHLTVAP
jgi:hypothetical protein